MELIAMKMKVMNEVLRLLEKYNRDHRDPHDLDEVKIHDIGFDIKGRAAGKARRDGDYYSVHFQPAIMERNFKNFLATTVPHEVAHIICYQAHPGCKAHGAEWKATMRKLGVKHVTRCHSHDMEGVKTRKESRHAYTCGCKTHMLSSRRHWRVVRSQSTYSCKLCGNQLTKED